MEHVRFVLPFETVFYTPHYLARALGLFAEEGVEAEQAVATVGNGVARALLAGDADVGLSGPLRALGALDRGEGRLVCVAEVNSRVGFFLLGRAPAHDFGWRDLAGRRVLVFAEAPTPRLCLEYLLERHGVRPGAVELIADVPTPQAVERFLAGRADYLLQGQPVTERLVAGGQAHVAAALGPALGPMAFSAYLVAPRFMTERAHALDAVLRALYRAQRWLHGHSAEESAARVAPAFPGEERAILAGAIRRYLAGKTWALDPILRRPGFDALQEVLLLRGFVKKSHPYDAVVDTARAEAAVRAVGAA
ncbi:MAG: ABC transporter substrate-binding protein [Candidatus Rokubacteria bacterium]|nr:ABC transporter substrate-binding protein [Candidatus Rokubacteria bacterium]